MHMYKKSAINKFWNKGVKGVKGSLELFWKFIKFPIPVIPDWAHIMIFFLLCIFCIYECVVGSSHNNWRPKGGKQNYPAPPDPPIAWNHTFIYVSYIKYHICIIYTYVSYMYHICIIYVSYHAQICTNLHWFHDQTINCTFRFVDAIAWR